MADVLNVKEAAALCGLEEVSIRAAAKDGRLKGRNMGHGWVFTLEAVEAFRDDPDRKTGPKRKSR